MFEVATAAGRWSVGSFKEDGQSEVCSSVYDKERTKRASSGAGSRG